MYKMHMIYEFALFCLLMDMTKSIVLKVADKTFIYKEIEK